MATDNSTRIAEIRSILAAGADQVVTDGVSVKYDFDALRRELRSLMLEDDAQRGRRPRAASIDLTGF